MNGWWVIACDTLMDSLKRCERGEHADLVYAELYANSDVEKR